MISSLVAEDLPIRASPPCCLCLVVHQRPFQRTSPQPLVHGDMWRQQIVPQPWQMNHAEGIPALQPEWVSWEKGRVSPLGFEGTVLRLLRHGKGIAGSKKMSSYLHRLSASTWTHVVDLWSTKETKTWVYLLKPGRVENSTLWAERSGDVKFMSTCCCTLLWPTLLNLVCVFPVLLPEQHHVLMILNGWMHACLLVNDKQN